MLFETGCPYVSHSFSLLFKYFSIDILQMAVDDPVARRYRRSATIFTPSGGFSAYVIDFAAIFALFAPSNRYDNTDLHRFAFFASFAGCK